ncbi:hypothetical protein D6D94_08345 [Moraxella catarrhalis]|uniref:Uncharacterized protein n=1 Tax=Moraxella catarrhalis TaxID=480 RepID=A0A3Q9GHF6_MORCA|nr:hypothetical protein [Moraxella catarrhalis]AZQ94322.1 hypothetical protein EJK53_0856 [Moraxella catarrhalis]AZQ94884.1 hypothetical protein EJK48_0863 [Moraxella catarrhalis]MCG6835658.1 hypothetical protein [Moraxella catarrhalis]MPX72638.1 hypothetical protein [Moraxella catarrhalis]RKL77818.1 hypothetical protein D6D94_08345 [Moraxella catarrhalis]
MKITLDNIELNQAVIEYLNNQGLTLNTNKVHIEITSEGVKIDTNKPNRQEAKDSVQEPVKPNKPNNKPKDSDIPAKQKKPAKALFNASDDTTDDILEDDTPTIPENQQVEKTRKLFQ